MRPKTAKTTDRLTNGPTKRGIESHSRQLKIEILVDSNKPDRAKMRPDCVLACIDYGDRHVSYIEGQIEGRTDR